MRSLKAERSLKWLRKKAKKGPERFPVATVAFYGRDDRTATKAVAAIVLAHGEEPQYLERWYSADTDIRSNAETLTAMVEYLKHHGAKSVTMVDGIIGCPHEEGIDYPEGESCPQCPFWAGRDRWAGVPRH